MFIFPKLVLKSKNWKCFSLKDWTQAMRVSEILLVLFLPYSTRPFAAIAEDNVGQRPNVVIFLADDLGFGDLPFYGHPTTTTPNLSKLAKKSKVFTDFYVASSVCSPSR
jgi:hypothetical protein